MFFDLELDHSDFELLAELSAQLVRRDSTIADDRPDSSVGEDEAGKVPDAAAGKQHQFRPVDREKGMSMANLL